LRDIGVFVFCGNGGRCHISRHPMWNHEMRSRSTRSPNVRDRQHAAIGLSPPHVPGQCASAPVPAIKRAPIAPLRAVPPELRGTGLRDPGEGSRHSLSSLMSHIVLHRVHKVIVVYCACTIRHVNWG
jgi:hypothetical protein